MAIADMVLIAFKTTHGTITPAWALSTVTCSIQALIIFITTTFTSINIAIPIVLHAHGQRTLNALLAIQGIIDGLSKVLSVKAIVQPEIMLHQEDIMANILSQHQTDTVPHVTQIADSV